MSFDVNWDIDKYKEEHESEDHWILRRNFMEKWKFNYPEERLVCLARAFANIEFMGCRYPPEVMQEIAEMSKEVNHHLTSNNIHTPQYCYSSYQNRSQGFGAARFWRRFKRVDNSDGSEPNYEEVYDDVVPDTENQTSFKQANPLMGYGSRSNTDYNIAGNTKPVNKDSTSVASNQGPESAYVWGQYSAEVMQGPINVSKVLQTAYSKSFIVETAKDNLSNPSKVTPNLNIAGTKSFISADGAHNNNNSDQLSLYQHNKLMNAHSSQMIGHKHISDNQTENNDSDNRLVLYPKETTFTVKAYGGKPSEVVKISYRPNLKNVYVYTRGHQHNLCKKPLSELKKQRAIWWMCQGMKIEEALLLCLRPYEMIYEEVSKGKHSLGTKISINKLLDQVMLHSKNDLANADDSSSDESDSDVNTACATQHQEQIRNIRGIEKDKQLDSSGAHNQLLSQGTVQGHTSNFLNSLHSKAQGATKNSAPNTDKIAQDIVNTQQCDSNVQKAPVNTGKHILNLTSSMAVRREEANRIRYEFFLKMGKTEAEAKLLAKNPFQFSPEFNHYKALLGTDNTHIKAPINNCNPMLNPTVSRNCRRKFLKRIKHKFFLKMGKTEEAKLLATELFKFVPKLNNYEALSKTDKTVQPINSNTHVKAPINTGNTLNSTVTNTISKHEAKQLRYEFFIKMGKTEDEARLLATELFDLIPEFNNYKALSRTDKTIQNIGTTLQITNCNKHIKPIISAGKPILNPTLGKNARKKKLQQIRYEFSLEMGKTKEEARLLAKYPAKLGKEFNNYKAIFKKLRQNDQNNLIINQKATHDTTHGNTEISNNAGVQVSDDKITNNNKAHIENKSTKPNDKPKLTEKQMLCFKWWVAQGKSEDEAYILCQQKFVISDAIKEMYKQNETVQPQEGKRILTWISRTSDDSHETVLPEYENSNNALGTEIYDKEIDSYIESVHENISEHLKIIIKDVNKEISLEECVDLQKTIIECITDEQVTINGCYRKSGCVIVTCPNVYSRDWLDKEIPTLIPWDGAQLQVIEESEIPILCYAWVYIPTVPETGLVKDLTDDDLKNLLHQQNPLVGCDKWFILNKREEQDGLLLMVRFDEKSNAVLAKRNHTLCWFSARPIRVKIKNKTRAKIQKKSQGNPPIETSRYPKNVTPPSYHPNMPASSHSASETIDYDIPNDNDGWDIEPLEKSNISDGATLYLQNQPETCELQWEIYNPFRDSNLAGLEEESPSASHRCIPEDPNTNITQILNDIYESRYGQYQENIHLPNASPHSDRNSFTMSVTSHEENEDTAGPSLDTDTSLPQKITETEEKDVTLDIAQSDSIESFQNVGTADVPMPMIPPLSLCAPVSMYASDVPMLPVPMYTSMSMYAPDVLMVPPLPMYAPMPMYPAASNTYNTTQPKPIQPNCIVTKTKANSKNCFTWIFFPPVPKLKRTKVKFLLEKLLEQNPGIGTKKWFVTDIEARVGGIMIGAHFAKQWDDALKARNGELKWFSHIIKTYVRKPSDQDLITQYKLKGVTKQAKVNKWYYPKSRNVEWRIIKG